MNAARRKMIDEAAAKISDAKNTLESVRDEEQDAFDAMPESIQAGEKGEKSQASIDALNSVIDSLDSAESDLETAKE